MNIFGAETEVDCDFTTSNDISDQQIFTEVNQLQIENSCLMVTMAMTNRFLINDDHFYFVRLCLQLRCDTHCVYDLSH